MKFPTFEGVNSTYKMEADNADIRKAIVQAVPKATEQVKEMAVSFSGSSDQETCKKIFDFLKNSINYEADGANQIIRYPSALLKTKKGDCKSYSLLTAAILNNLKIPCRFVLQSFNEDPTPSHIYVETLSGVKCDAVWGKFNSEKPSTFKYYIPMNVKYMSGIGGVKTMGNCGCATCNTAIGSVKIGLTAENRAECDKKHPVLRTWFGDTNRLSRQACYTSKEIQEKAKQAKNWVDELNLKKYFGSIPRQITLGIYSLNLDGLASNINNTPAKSKLLDEWIRLGGDPKALDRAIVDGSSKKPIKWGMRSAVEKKIREILNKNKVISGVDNARIREQAKKLLMEPNPVSDGYMATLVALGGTYGGIGGGIVGSAIPVVGNATGAAVGATMGGSLGYFLFNQTPNLIDSIFPVDGNKGGDTTNQGDPQNTGTRTGGSASYDESGCAFITVMGKKIPFPAANKPTCVPNNQKEDKTLKAGFGNAVLPILIGVGVIMALNKSKK
jgi:hypothetical protein